MYSRTGWSEGRDQLRRVRDERLGTIGVNHDWSHQEEFEEATMKSLKKSKAAVDDGQKKNRRRAVAMAEPPVGTAG